MTKGYVMDSFAEPDHFYLALASKIFMQAHGPTLLVYSI
jgi:hypothetical protein